MGTRAVYTFKDENGDKFHVFKHWDNYPSGAKNFIENALDCSWQLPRFEADEFACSFIASNKRDRGDIRLCNHYDDYGNLDYRYEIYMEEDKLYVDAYRAADVETPWILIFHGSLDEFKNFEEKEVD